MAERGQTSSMTSVTEDDISAGSESDTTESSYSNITSSLLSSTDTDDKLTPGLIKISISNTKNATKRTVKLLNKCKPKTAVTDKSGDSPINEQILQAEVKDPEVITCEKDVSVATAHISGRNFAHPNGSNISQLPHVTQKQGRCKENLNMDDIYGKFSTDTSTTQIYKNRNNNNQFNVDSDENKDSESVHSINLGSSFLPDLSSDRWYQAPCFDRYWSHYRFVMEWYHMHVHAVKVLQAQMSGVWCHPQEFSHSQGIWHSHRENSRRNQQSRKSYHRRGAKDKARQKLCKQSQSASFSAGYQDNVVHARTQLSRQKIHSHEEEDEEELLEMEITDDMLDFFTTSYRHKLERAKAEERPISLAPTERPGVKRSQEMKEIYGTGAPMVQAMETAMQMTFDRFLDKFQPCLWPNMPLKINFTK